MFPKCNVIYYPASATIDGVGISLVGAVWRSISVFAKSCSLNNSSNASRVAKCCANAAWDIRPILWCESLFVRISRRVRPGMRTSTSGPSSRTMRSGIGAEGFDGGAGAGAVTANAGTGATVAGAAAVAAGVGWIHT